MLIRGFALDEVRITEPVLLNAQKKEKEYLASVDVDRLLAGFRETSGLPKRADRYPGGWENSELSGHTLGHYLVAMAQLYAATGSGEVKEQLEYVLQDLSACQAGRGYLFASEEEIFDRLEKGGLVWMPWYTMHKLITGLLAVHRLVQLPLAFTIVKKLGSWVCHRVLNWTEKEQRRALSIADGGMNDCLYELYKETGEEEYLAAAAKFDELALYEKLAEGKDALPNKHANNTIPKFLGALNRYMVMGESEELYRKAAESFFDIVERDHTYITGGNGELDHFRASKALGENRTQCNCEACSSFNMLKLAERLYSITGDKKYMDYYERTYFNAILGSQNPETGMTAFYQPMAPGYFKTFSTPHSSFWCCTGTGMESFTKLNQAIYHKTDDHLYVNLYVASEVTSEEFGMRMTQTVSMDDFDTVGLRFRMSAPKAFTLCLRIPEWTEDKFEITVNGETPKYTTEGGYLVLERTWADADRIELQFFPKIRIHPLPDAKNCVAISYGPFALAAGLGMDDMTTERMRTKVIVPTKNVAVRERILLNEGLRLDKWFEDCDVNFVKSKKELAFALRGTDADKELTFTPYYKVYNERYGIYFNYHDTENLPDDLRAIIEEQKRIEEERRAAEEERLRKEAEEAARRAEEERIRKEEEERRAEAERLRKEEEEAERRRLEEEERKRREVEEARLAEEERLRKEEEERLAEEERKRLEAEEAERRRLEEEERKRLEAEEAERKRLEAEEAERLRLEAEEKARLEAEEAARLAAEAALLAEAERIRQEEEEERRRKEEEEKARLEAEKAARLAEEKRLAEEERKRLEAEEAEKRRIEEEERKRLEAEEAARQAEEKRLAEEERKRLEAEEAEKRRAEEEEKARRDAEEAEKRRAEEEEKARRDAEEAEKRRAEEEEKARRDAEEAQKQISEDVKREADQKLADAEHAAEIAAAKAAEEEANLQAARMAQERAESEAALAKAQAEIEEAKAAKAEGLARQAKASKKRKKYRTYHEFKAGKVFLGFLFVLACVIAIYVFATPISKVFFKGKDAVDTFLVEKLPSAANFLKIKGNGDAIPLFKETEGVVYLVETADKFVAETAWPQGYQASVVRLNGKQYICVEGNGLKMYYLNEIAETDTKHVYMEAGTKKALYFWDYSFSNPEVLCPRAGKFNTSEKDQYAFYYRGEVNDLHILDKDTLEECKIALNEATAAQILNVENYREEEECVRVDLMAEDISYAFAVPKKAGASLPDGYEVSLDSFKYSLDESGILFEAYVVSADSYIGKIVGNLNYTNQIYMVDRFGFYAYAGEEYGKVEGKSIYTATSRTAAQGEKMEVLGNNGEHLLVPLQTEVKRNEYNKDGFLTEKNGELRYVVDGNTVSIKGIDVARAHGTIDWETVAASGVEYAMIRIGIRGDEEGGKCQLDANYTRNIREAVKAGVGAGVYFTSRATTVDEAKEEAQFVIRNVADYDLTWPIAVDMVEVAGGEATRASELSKEDRTACVKAFMDEIAIAGYTPVLYTDAGWSAFEFDLNQLTNYDIWYNSKEALAEYPYHYTMRQYADGAEVPGIEETVNLNISFIDYGAEKKQEQEQEQ